MTVSGYVYADLHNHVRTSADMTGLLGRLIKRTARTMPRPAMVGIIDFNNFGEESRLTQLERQAGDFAYTAGNALYFPIEEVLLVRGQEVPTKEGHLLVLGMKRGQELQPGRSLLDSLKEARDYNCITVVDHPFSPQGGLGPFLLKNPSYLLDTDGWEIHNGETAFFPAANKTAELVYLEAIKGKLPIGALAGSDGHSLYEVGGSWTRFSRPSLEAMKNPDYLVEWLRDSIRRTQTTSREVHQKQNAFLGALDHFADLAFSEALRKVGLRK